MATLSKHGKGGADFTRSIGAVTLLGCGFGEVIKPIATDFCGYWAELPKQKYYIAICVSDLNQIMETCSDFRQAMEMIDISDLGKNLHQALGAGTAAQNSSNITWHGSGDIFAPCQCQGLLNALEHDDPVQFLLPSNLPLGSLRRKDLFCRRLWRRDLWAELRLQLGMGRLRALLNRDIPKTRSQRKSRIQIPGGLILRQRVRQRQSILGGVEK